MHGLDAALSAPSFMSSIPVSMETVLSITHFLFQGLTDSSETGIANTGLICILLFLAYLVKMLYQRQSNLMVIMEKRNSVSNQTLNVQYHFMSTEKFF